MKIDSSRELFLMATVIVLILAFSGSDAADRETATCGVTTIIGESPCTQWERGDTIFFLIWYNQGVVKMHGLQTMSRVNNQNVLHSLAYSTGEPVRVEHVIDGQLTSVISPVNQNDPASPTLHVSGFEFRKEDGRCISGDNISIKAVGKYARAEDRVADAYEQIAPCGEFAEHDTENQFAVG
jgi:hypothetical protein